MTLPRGWAKTVLNHIAFVQTGLSKSENRQGPSVRKPYLRVANVQDGYLDLREVKEIDVPEGQLDRFLLQPGDLLLTEGGDFDKLGRGCIWNGEIPECVHQNHIFAVRLTEKNRISPQFLAYQMQSNYGRAYFLACAKQTTNLASINSSQLKDFPVLIPPPFEQERTCSVLSTWDTAIEKTERLIATKTRLQKALANRLLFGLTRLGSRVSRNYLSSHWFRTPNDWEIVSIGNVANEVSITNNKVSLLPVLSCTKYDGLVDSLKYFGKQVFASDTSNYKVVKRGQFAYATNHLEEGSIGYQTAYQAGLVSPIYTVFETDKKRVNDGYLFKLLKTETFRHLFEVNTSASVDRRGSLRWSQFAQIKIPLPSLQEQTEINAVLEVSLKEITLLKDYLRLLAKQKRGLMQKLLTGQWRVKVADTEAA